MSELSLASMIMETQFISIQCLSMEHLGPVRIQDQEMVTPICHQGIHKIIDLLVDFVLYQELFLMASTPSEDSQTACMRLTSPLN